MSSVACLANSTDVKPDRPAGLRVADGVVLPKFGRGAWTREGKGNTSSASYTAEGGGPGRWDGSLDPAADTAALAVRAAVKSVQALTRSLGFPKPNRSDGIFGPVTGEAVAWCHQQLGTRYYPSGNPVFHDGDNDARYYGQAGGRYFANALIRDEARAAGIPAWMPWGIALHESVHDDGAVGYTTPADCGRYQINTQATGLTREQCHDVFFATRYTCERLADYAAAHRIGGRAWQSQRLQWSVMIGQHYWPAGAEQWWRTGQVPAGDAGEKMRVYADQVIDELGPQMPAAA